MHRFADLEGQPMVPVRRPTMRYRTVTAVDDNLSVEAGPGRVTGFLGPNGAGKTTTLPILPGPGRPR
jgi:ABC-2 type transport system ATP-binding protein